MSVGPEGGLMTRTIGRREFLKTGAGAGLTLYGRSESGRSNLDALKLKLPFFGQCIRKMSIAPTS